MSRNFSLIFFLSVFLLFLFIPASLPIEGGIFFIAFGIFYLGIQCFKYSSFKISKAFVVFAALFIYLFVYQFYAKPIPVTDVVIQRLLISFLLMLFAYVSLSSEMVRRVWENALIILAIVVSLASVFEILDWYLRYFEVKGLLQYMPMPRISYRLKGFLFGHPNPLAGFLNFVWPLVFIRLYNSRNLKKRFLLLGVLLLIAFSFVYTNSRGALLGTFFGVFVLFLALGFRKGFALSIKTIFRNKKTKVSVFVGAGVLGVLFISMLWRSMFTGQFSNRSFSGRGTIWRYSWQAFMEKPFFGQGIGAFPISYTKLAQLPPGEFAPSAHNLWLQLSVDYGIIGLAFICALVGFFFFYAVKALLNQGDGEFSHKFAYIAAGVAFLAQQTVDYMFVTMSYLVFALVILTFLLKYVVLVGEWRLERSSYLLLVSAIIAGLTIYQYAISSQVTNFSKYAEASRLYAQENWLPLEEIICSGADEHSVNALYKFECSAAIVQQVFSEKEERTGSSGDEMLNKAIYYQQDGIDLNPYWATQDANLAVLYWERGDRSRALALMDNAVANAPKSDIFLLTLGWMEEMLGDEDAALEHYKTALRLNPLINLSEFSEASELIPVAAEDLLTWLDSDELWEDWYNMERHDRGPKEFLYWKGIIALSTGQNKLAIEYFEKNFDAGSTASPIYLAYAYSLDGQANIAQAIVQDIILLSEKGIQSTSSFPMALSVVASILRNGGNTDGAYELLLDAFEVSNKKIYIARYYPAIYTQQIIGSDISPLLIRNYNSLPYTQGDWEWLVEETLQRGDIYLAERIERWQNNLGGIAR